MAKLLYLLCEGEKDALFYETIAERVTSLSFERVDRPTRQTSNWKTVLAASRLLMSEMKRWQGDRAICVILAVDNDRCSDHPAANTYPRKLPPHDQGRASRYQELKKIVEDKLGADRAQWPVSLALAVPVEMIERWLLRLLNPSREGLPIFSEAFQASTRAYYAGKLPPPQLKDLAEEERRNRGMTADELFLHAAEHGDLEAAASSCPSLAMFLEELRAWP